MWRTRCASAYLNITSERYLEEADQEFQEHVGYFDNISRTTARKFVDQVESAVTAIRQYPEIGAPLTRRVRKQIVTGFKYSVLYVDTPDEIVIVAVAPPRLLAKATATPETVGQDRQKRARLVVHLSLLPLMRRASGAQVFAATVLVASAAFEVRSATFGVGAPEAQAFVTPAMLRAPERQASPLRSVAKQLPRVLIAPPSKVRAPGAQAFVTRTMLRAPGHQALPLRSVAKQLPAC